MSRKPSYRKERTERRISSATCLLLCALTIVLQIALSLLISRFLLGRAVFVYGALAVIGAVVAVRVYIRPGSPTYKMAWMCLLLAMPVAGMLLFWVWGGSHQAKSLSMKKIPPIRIRESQRMENETNLARLRRQSPEWGRLSTYLQKRGFLLYRNTQTKYLSSGEAFFESLIADLAQAETYIFMEYYILAEGQLWDRILAVLRQRAAAGVEVHIIFDDFGALTRLTDETVGQLEASGIAVEAFNPVHRYISRIYFNYRDHRKITVIDGQVAYVGGINIGDEYANIVERFGHWKDSAVRLEGDGAWGIAMQFIQMWKMLGRTLPNEDDYYRSRHESKETRGFCQPFADGPLNNPDNPAEEVYLQLISSAKRMVYLTTPYYAVEEAMQKALCIAADAGVDVRLMVPGIPDHHKFTYMVAETYWGELMRHGVKIYKYTPGFLHSKCVMVDREVALVGSINMDYRSFQLHYECGVLLYHCEAVEETLEDLDQVMALSQRYTLEDWTRRPWYRRAIGSTLRLGAIWL